MRLLPWLSLAFVGLPSTEALPGAKSASSLSERQDGFSHSKTAVRIQKRALRGRAAAPDNLKNRRQRRKSLRRGQRLKRTNCQPDQDCIEYAPDGEQAVIPIDEQPNPTATKVGFQEPVV